MHTYNLTVHSHVEIREGCPIQFTVAGCNDVWWSCGDGTGEEFQFLLDFEILRKFLRLGSEALREMEAHCAAERTDDWDEEPEPTSVAGDV